VAFALGVAAVAVRNDIGAWLEAIREKIEREQKEKGEERA